MGFLTGKTAIITGAGRAVLSDGRCGSIGYGIATAYAKEGCNLVITGRNMKKLTDAKEELESKYGIKVLAVQADVSEGQDNKAVVENVVKQAVDTFGGIDVLINNAQASASGVTLADHTLEQFNLAMYSGLYATFHYMQAAYPYLAKAKGSVKKIGGEPVLQLERFWTEGRLTHENIPFAEITDVLPGYLGTQFRQADLVTADGSASLMISSKGKVCAFSIAGNEENEKYLL